MKLQTSESLVSTILNLVGKKILVSEDTEAKEGKTPEISSTKIEIPDDLTSLKEMTFDMGKVEEQLEDYLKTQVINFPQIYESIDGEADIMKIPIMELPKYYAHTIDNLDLVKKLESENKVLQERVEAQITMIQQTTSYMSGLVTELESQKSEIEDKKNHLTRVLQSINQASKIQMSLMHSEKDLQEILPNSFLIIKPKDIVSGDFLWIGRRTNRLFIVVADCTGHGVPGAFMSMMGKLILNQVIIEIGLDDVVSILTAVDAKVNKALNYANEGMELGILKVLLDEKKIEFAGAHRPLCIARNGEIEELKGGSFGVGGSHKTVMKYFEKNIIVEAGDTSISRVFLFSDGYPDQIGGENSRKMTNAKFRNILHETQTLPIALQKQALESKLIEWQQHHKQTDDIIVLGLDLESVWNL